MNHQSILICIGMKFACNKNSFLVYKITLYEDLVLSFLQFSIFFLVVNHGVFCYKIFEVTVVLFRSDVGVISVLEFLIFFSCKSWVVCYKIFEVTVELKQSLIVSTVLDTILYFKNWHFLNIKSLEVTVVENCFQQFSIHF